MAQRVSKVRARKTKDRERRAGKAAPHGSPLATSPLVGIFLGILLWAIATAFLTIDTFIANETGPSAILRIAGDSVFLLISLVATAFFLNIMRPDVLRRNSRILLLIVVSGIALAVAAVLMNVPEEHRFLPPAVAVFLLPVSFAPLLATILMDGAVGIAAGVWTSMAMAVLAGHDFALLVTGMIATVVTAQTARNVRTRSKLFRIGLLVGIAEIASVLGLTALMWDNHEPIYALQQAGACFVSSFSSALVVLLVLPVFESLFRITTNITLLELSDLGHPLLQRLAIEAPGTYHHSLVVANLAQAAADEIGANALMARVCSYFHDVGKLTKPDFFAENIQMQNNPHDDLPPSMSTLIITSHVKEGLSLGLLHKLPEPVLDVIREHHGTSLLRFFHHKASTELELETGHQPNAGAAAPVDDTNFRYTGPKPTSRESTIIALADAVEAASRSMEKTTPGHIEHLVEEIATARVMDGQLSNCNLTFSDFTKVKRSFIFTLTNMLHGRVSYPKDESNNKQSAKTAPNKRKESQDSGTVPSEAGATERADSDQK